MGTVLQIAVGLMLGIVYLMKVDFSSFPPSEGLLLRIPQCVRSNMTTEDWTHYSTVLIMRFVTLSIFTGTVSCRLKGDAEIARTDITRPDNAAPDSRVGHRETWQLEQRGPKQMCSRKYSSWWHGCTEVMRTSRTSFSVWWVCRCCRRKKS